MCYIAGNACCYALFTFRLYYGFKGSQYAVKRYQIILLIICIVLYIGFGSITIWIAIHFGVGKNTKLFGWNDELYYDIRTVYSSGAQTMDLILTVSLLALFITKLRQVTQNLYLLSAQNDVERLTLDTMSDSVSNIDTSISNLDNSKENMFNIISKIFILSITMIIFTQITLICTIIYSISLRVNNDSSVDDTKLNVETLDMVRVTLKIITCFTSSLCLFLYFEFTQKYYTKLCGKCHKIVKNSQVKTVHKKVSYYIQVQK